MRFHPKMLSSHTQKIAICINLFGLVLKYKICTDLCWAHDLGVEGSDEVGAALAADVLQLLQQDRAREQTAAVRFLSLLTAH
jgi:hypothetical protein